jgi:K+-sensing histidine kinase KdpD
MISSAPEWFRQYALPVLATAIATGVTWILWPYIRPSASPLFFLAVMVSSVYGGMLAGLAATMLAAVVTAYLFMSPEFSLSVDSGDVFRLIVFGSVALLTNSIAAERNKTDAAQRRLLEDLRAANARIRTLSDMLPVCPDCKRVRVGGSDEGWKTVESYLAETPELQVTHALCPDCSARHFPEFQARTV